jgi:hypothetical protein
MVKALTSRLSAVRSYYNNSKNIKVKTMRIKPQHLEKLTLGKRKFDVNHLYNSIKNTRTFFSWGVTHKVNYFDKALAVKVNAHHFTGIVFITVAGNDTFSIYYLKSMEVVDEVHNIYIDDLLIIIDDKIEYIKEYGDN